MIESGSVVRRLHPDDGTKQAGKAMGRFLHVVAIRLDKPVTMGCVEHVAILDDGKHEFLWNLVEIDVDI